MAETAAHKGAPALLDPAYLSSIANYALLARIAVEGFLSGHHRSLFHGFGSEFLQFRAYSPGEDPRYIDWKTYARRGRLQTKVYQEETNMNLTMVLDASASMEYQGLRGPCGKLRYACMLSATLAYLAARQGDKVGLIVYNNTLRDAMKPGQRSGRLASLYHVLARCQPQGSADHTLLCDYLGHQLKGRGMVVFISDMLEAEDQIPALLARIRIRHHDLIALQILDPDETELPTNDAARFVDMESGMEVVTSPEKVAGRYNRSMQTALDQLANGFRESRIDYHRLSTDMHLGKALAAYLHRRNQSAARNFQHSRH